jgi:ubiquinone/menaquinone biosynthesis C-methylase UbiE
VTSITPDPNLRVYNSPEVAAHYAALDYLTPCEQVFFGAYLRKGMAILDIGVGGGRTVPFLASIAGRYVGVDYSGEMIAICHQKFPDLEFHTANAADLSLFGEHSFDVVVMAFNSMDYVIPDESRFSCLREIGRVLSNEGLLIFSSHNPRAIIVRPCWNRKRLEELAKGMTRGLPALQPLLLPLLLGARALLAAGQATIETSVRVVQRCFTRAFWVGEGYLYDKAHGGLKTHCAVPRRVETELAKFGFRIERLLGDDYPATTCPYVTDWYYYAFRKMQSARETATCA